ncbi:MAG: hypothetical protein STSR0002_12470 [Smithella sp.]
MSTRGFVLRRNISGQRSLDFFKDDFTKISYRDTSQIINKLGSPKRKSMQRDTDIYLD